MFNIGIFKFKENKSADTYIKKLEKKYKIDFFKSNVESEYIEGLYQAVLIFENELSDLNKICELIITLRKSSNCRIFVISTASQEIGKMAYLQLGADIVFNQGQSTPEEVQLIISNALRREAELSLEIKSEGERARESNLLQLIPGNLSVLIEGKKEVPLTRLEYQVLDLLSRKPKKAFSYETIFQELYKNEPEGNKNYRVANIIFHLRKKMEKEANQPKYIKTVRSKGYMLDIN